MQIRKAKKADINGIYEVFLDFRDLVYKSQSDIPYKHRKASVIKENFSKEMSQRNVRFIVAEENGVIGYIIGVVLKEKKATTHIKPKIGEFGIAVKKEYTGKGVGTQLYKELEKYFKKQKCYSVNLKVLANSPAVNFYKKLGFETSIFIMSKKL